MELHSVIIVEARKKTPEQIEARQRELRAMQKRIKELKKQMEKEGIINIELSMEELMKGRVDEIF